MYTFTILIVYLLLTVYTFIISETNRTMYQLSICKQTTRSEVASVQFNQPDASYHENINHTINVSLEE